MVMSRYPILHTMITPEPISLKMKCYGNIVCDNAPTLRPTMGINHQNKKQNHEKIAKTLPPQTNFSLNIQNLVR